MSLYDTVAVIADLVRPYVSDPVFNVDPRNPNEVKRDWPVGKDDGGYIDVFGQLKDRAFVDGNPVKLRFCASKTPTIAPADDEQIDGDAWTLEFPEGARNPNGGQLPAAKYDIHKGFRVPYDYMIPEVDGNGEPMTGEDGNPAMKKVYANVIVLFTGWAQS